VEGISAYCLAQPMNLVQTKKYTAGRPGGISTADRAATACPTPMPTEERIHPTLAGLATAGDETVPQRHSKKSGHRQTCSECVVRLKVADIEHTGGPSKMMARKALSGRKQPYRCIDGAGGRGAYTS
jgi:hypothetical protein